MKSRAPILHLSPIFSLPLLSSPCKTRRKGQSSEMLIVNDNYLAVSDRWLEEGRVNQSGRRTTSVSTKDNWSSDKLISAASFLRAPTDRIHVPHCVIGPLSHRVGASRSCLMRIEGKRVWTLVLFRHPCDLIVHSSALFSFFNHPFPCRFFFSFQKEQRIKARGDR